MESSLNNPPRLKTWATVFLILGILGFADATFLTFKNYSGGTVPCFITGGCDAVTRSSYSKIAGVPVALLGAINYLIIMVLSLIVVDSHSVVWLRRLAWWTIFGFLFTMYFLYIQAFVLHAYCIYCLVSAGISTALFALSLPVHRSFRKVS